MGNNPNDMIKGRVAETIVEELKKVIAAQTKMVYTPKNKSEAADTGSVRPLQEKLELYLLSLLLQGKTREFFEE